MDLKAQTKREKTAPDTRGCIYIQVCRCVAADVIVVSVEARRVMAW
jgi:hypothetical protein